MGRIVAALAVAVTLGGCAGAGGGFPRRVGIDWDLSRRHTMADVHWPASAADLDAHEARPTGPVHIRLPGRRRFDAAHGIRRVDVSREGEVVDDVSVFSAPLEIDDGYRLALAWARRYGLPRAGLDEWRERVRGEKPPDLSAGQSIDNRRFLAPGGPVPSVEVRTSFDVDRPVVVSVEFFWPRPRPGGALGR